MKLKGILMETFFGIASAMLYSLIETAKENNLNLFNYIQYVLEKLPNIDIQDNQELDKLMP